MPKNQMKKIIRLFILLILLDPEPDNLKINSLEETCRRLVVMLHAFDPNTQEVEAEAG